MPRPPPPLHRRSPASFALRARCTRSPSFRGAGENPPDESETKSARGWPFAGSATGAGALFASSLGFFGKSAADLEPRSLGRCADGLRWSVSASRCSSSVTNQDAILKRKKGGAGLNTDAAPPRPFRAPLLAPRPAQRSGTICAGWAPTDIIETEAPSLARRFRSAVPPRRPRTVPGSLMRARRHGRGCRPRLAA